MDMELSEPGPQVSGGSCDVSVRSRQCFDIINTCYPGANITFLANQGYCSYTFLVARLPRRNNSPGPKFIVQFRRSKFDLDLDIASIATQTYGAYAPETGELLDLINSTRIRIDLDLRAYQMDLIGGVTYKSLAPDHIGLTEAEFDRQIKLVEGFANFIARAWPGRPSQKVGCTGKVGAILPQKIQALAASLPSPDLRTAAHDASKALGSLDALPNVLNHGDIVPSNVMIDPATFHLVGLVDWAEAEYLPFGTCLYGLEHFLGIMTASRNGQQEFKYYKRAYELRFHFWQHLQFLIPALRGKEFSDAILLAKKIGVLLWHGFAWDDGAIDRVVNENDDPEEIVYLEAFVSACGDDLLCLKQHRRDSVLT